MRNIWVCLFFFYGLINVVNAEEIKKASVDIVKDMSSNNEDTNLKSLPVFGMSFVNQVTNTTNLNKINVRDDYKIKVKDVLLINVFGYEDVKFTLSVDKTGNVVLPKYGPVKIINEDFGIVKKILKKSLKEVYPNSESIITMEDVSSIEISINGNIKAPGTYMLGAYSTLIDALRISKGFNSNSSFRDVTLERNNKKISIDLYDYLLGKKNFNQLLLKDGDVITVNIANIQIGVEGEVRSAGIFELTKKENLDDLLLYAKGLTAKANKNNVLLKRLDAVHGRTLQYINLDNKTTVLDGDYIKVGQLIKDEQLYVTISGEIVNPGSYVYVDGIVLADILKISEGFTTAADNEEVLITRMSMIKGERTNKIFTTNDFNMLLKPFDNIVVRKLKNWDSLISIQVIGQVRSPGSYRLKEGSTVEDILHLSNGFNNKADVKGSYIVRQSLKTRQEELQQEKLNDLQSRLSAAIYASMFDDVSANEAKIKIMNIQSQISLLQANTTVQKVFGKINLSLSEQENKNSSYRFQLQDRDILYVPNRENYIAVEGAVLSPSTFVYDDTTGINEYIEKSGGLGRDIDETLSYILKTNGEAKKILFENGKIKEQPIDPGDMIIIGRSVRNAN